MITTRVKEIINSIVKAMGTMKDVVSIERKLYSKFSGQGYRYAEIQEAFNILLDMLDHDRSGRQDRRDRRPVRVLSPREDLKLTTEARSLLLGLYYGGELEYDEMEEILNSVSVQERIFSDEDIRLMLVVFFNKIVPAAGDAGGASAVN